MSFAGESAFVVDVYRSGGIEALAWVCSEVRAWRRLKLSALPVSSSSSLDGHGRSARIGIGRRTLRFGN
jgi:hypothetical protein